MRHLYITLLTVLMGGIAAQAQTADYQPLVREGVRWVNVHEAMYDTFGQHFREFYRYEFRGDTIINGKTYKKCYRYNTKSLDMAIDTPYCAMREQGHRVYEVPFNLDESHTFFKTAFWSFFYMENLYTELMNTGEFTLFDFDNPEYPWGEDVKNQIVQGIGFNSDWFGDAFHPCTGVCTCLDYDKFSFHHLEDMDGNVLFEGANFGQRETKDYDLNGDGKVDIADVNIVIDGIVNGTYDLDAADVTGDDKIDIADVNAIIGAMLTK